MSSLPVAATVPVPAGTVRIRPWRAGDDRLLVAADRSISADSRQARFFAGTRALPVAYLRFVATAPPERRIAVVATVGGQLVGWAEAVRPHRDPPGGTRAELGVLVVDAWQRRGVARLLFDALVAQCRGAGIAGLFAEVLVDNVAARWALRSLAAARPVGTADGDSLRYEIPLGPVPLGGRRR